MTDEKKPDQLEIEKVKLERFKEWWRIITAAIAVVFRSAEVVQSQYQAQLDPLPKEPKIAFGRKKAGLDEELRPLEYTDNEYELQRNGKAVYDNATGLMWQQSGSGISILPANKEKYIAKLKSENFAGYNNWRLPTLQEAKFLLEPKKNETNNLYIVPIFNKRQHEILTSNFYNFFECWVVDFSGGIYNDECENWFNYVRAVR